MIRRLAALLFATALVTASFVPAVIAKNGGGNADSAPAAVSSAADLAKSKLHPKLLRQLESGSTDQLLVYAVVNGGHRQARSYLKNAHVADGGDAAILVGTIGAQALPKLAGARNVVSVGPIEFKQTGRPLGIPDPDLGKRRLSADDLNKALRGLYEQEVPYDEAPPLAGSNFEALKELAVLDAKSHNFAEAWEAGYTGTGVTVGVMDGGTDFGHPDLIGTWQVWAGQTGARAGWNGWPKAFDPFGTLQLLSAPSQITSGLSWYVETTAKACPGWEDKGPTSPCAINFRTRTGPSRNFSAPSGTKPHLYKFPASWTKSGDVFLGSHPDDHLLRLFGERAAFLVTDPNTAGVYDTVYVDLDGDYSFADEKPVTKASPVSYRDMDGDGYTDLSGGLLYFISDGTTAVPGGVDVFLGPVTLDYGPGELVAWTGDFDPAIGGHGTLTASNVVGQGVINGLAPEFSDLPGDGTYPGAVIGGAPDAKLAPYGDIYFSIDFSTQFGYFLASRRGVDITSNSYGFSNVDNDGWDAASQEADVIYNNTRTTPLFSTGNGAPGFGTTAPPSPSAAIAVGASTQFGGTGWDSIDAASQIVDNDVMVWSNRGFGATGSPGVDVVADGAFSAGDSTLNAVLDGRFAWETWGGTSRSAPVAAGATALIYEAWRDANGPSVPANFFRTAKDILKSSSQDLGYNATIQGAGSVDAGKAVATALGTRARVSPNEWRVGDYRGAEYPVFSHLIAPGGSDAQSFTINGPGTWDISDRQLVRTDVETLGFSSENLAKESPANFNAPDYLMDLTDEVNAHPDADLLVIRLNYPRDQFDGHPQNYDEDQAWRLLTYNWTDVNGDDNLWTDNNGNGVVNYVTLPTSSNIDGFADINYGASEIDEGEYVRFMYHRAGSNALMAFVRDPADRMADGLFLGLQHSARNPSIPVTDFEVEIAWYENVDWDWISTPASAAGSFTADIDVPEGTPYGMYEGAIVLENGADSIVVPVAVAVAATATQDGDGKITGAIEFGGAAVAAAQDDLLYNNGAVFGANDWTWRAESGDWRFFFLDVPVAPPDGSLFLANTTWDGTAPYTDIDTLIMGRSVNHFQVFGDTVFGGPYVIDTLGASPNTHIGSGVWTFNTATGGAADFVAAPAQEGLHGVALHQVGWQGDDFTTPFSVTLGAASVAPSAVDIESPADSGSFDVTFESGIALDGLVGEAFGLSQPILEDVQGQQDNPNDPSSASIKRDVAIAHASRLTVQTTLATDDFDLFVVYDANADGVFTTGEIVGSSTTGSSNEFVELVAPADGDYQVWVQGWSVAGTPTLELLIDAIQGTDLEVTGLPGGPVAAGEPITLTINFSKSMSVGEDYFGELLLGPPSAPTALKVPIKITRT